MSEYTLQDVLNALKQADKVGNRDDAVKLANIARRIIREQEMEESPRGAVPFMVRGAANILGLPADAARSLVNLIPGVDIQPEQFGSRAIERGFRSFGLPTPHPAQEPETLWEHLGRSTGETATAFLPGMMVAKTASTAPGLLGGVAKSVYDMAVRHPKLTLAAEMGAGLGAGGGEYAAKHYEMSPMSQNLMMLAGGLLGGVAPTVATRVGGVTPLGLAARSVAKQFRKHKLMGGEAGSQYRAGELLKKQVSDPAEVARLLGEPTVGELPHTIATGERRLMELMKLYMEVDPVKEAEVAERLGRSITKLADELIFMGGKYDPELLRTALNKRISDIRERMNRRVEEAQARARLKLESIPVAQKRSEESRIVMNELRDVMLQEKKRIDNLWADVPRETKVRMDETRNEYLSLLKNTPQAQMEDIPGELKRSILATSNPDEPVWTNVHEMQGLRSKLLETARIARAHDQYNKARIADEFANLILSDMSTQADTESLRIAISASQEFYNRFHRGATARLLGYSSYGGAAISPDIALDVTLARRGARGAVDIDKIVATPEARAAAERFIARNFVDHAVDMSTGKISPLKSATWIKNNDEVLESFPNLKAKIVDAQAAQELADRVRQNMEIRMKRLRNPETVRAAEILDMDIGREVATIFKSPNPERLTANLLYYARKMSPQSINGIKGSFLENLIDKAAEASYNQFGEKMISGRKMRNLLNKHKNVYRMVFTDKEIEKINRIADEFALVEKFGAAKAADVSRIEKDLPKSAIQIIAEKGAGIVGAAVGRGFGHAIGAPGTVQIPGKWARIFEHLQKVAVKDRAKAIVTDAILYDPDLLKALMLPLEKPYGKLNLQNIDEVESTLQAWLLGAGRRVLIDEQEEEKEIY